MANNYTGFSFVVELKDKADEAWWEELFAACDVLQEAPGSWKTDVENNTPKVLKLSDILDDYHGDSASGFGVDIQFEPFKPALNPSDVHRDIWFHSGDGTGNSSVAAQLIQWFLQDRGRDDVVVFSWCDYCERPRIGQFGGGTVRITAEHIRAVSTGDLERDARDNRGLFL